MQYYDNIFIFIEMQQMLSWSSQYYSYLSQRNQQVSSSISVGATFNIVAADAGTIVTAVEGTDTKLVPELPMEIIVVGFGNNCLVDDALLLSCEDLALLLVLDWGVPGRIGETLPESLFDEETMGNETIIASSSGSLSPKSSESLSLFSTSFIAFAQSVYSSSSLLSPKLDFDFLQESIPC
jgi:hypothetical protein